jgi:hypothetical protein
MRSKIFESETELGQNFFVRNDLATVEGGAGSGDLTNFFLRDWLIVQGALARLRATGSVITSSRSMTAEIWLGARRSIRSCACRFSFAGAIRNSLRTDVRRARRRLGTPKSRLQARPAFGRGRWLFISPNFRIL